MVGIGVGEGVGVGRAVVAGDGESVCEGDVLPGEDIGNGVGCM